MIDLIIVGSAIVLLTVLLVVSIWVLDRFGTYMPDRRKHRKEEREFWKEVRNRVDEQDWYKRKTDLHWFKRKKRGKAEA